MDDPRPEARNGAAEPRTIHADASEPRVRCVAVLPPGTDEPAELTRAMARRGVRVTYYRTVYEAMTGLLAEPSGVSSALVLVEPERFPHDQARRLWAAAGRHVEPLACWQFAGDSSPRLRPYAPVEIAEIPDAFRPAPEPAAPVAPADPPRLRLAGLDDELPEFGFDDHDEDLDPDELPRTPSELLTPDEIAMLLDDPVEGPADGPGEGLA